MPVERKGAFDSSDMINAKHRHGGHPVNVQDLPDRSLFCGNLVTRRSRTRQVKSAHAFSDLAFAFHPAHDFLTDKASLLVIKSAKFIHAGIHGENAHGLEIPLTVRDTK